MVTEPSTGKVLASDAAMQPVADFLQGGCIDYLGHEGLFLEVGRRTGALCGAFLWNTKRGAAGGLGEGGGDRVSEADEASALLGLVPRPAGGVASGALAAPTRWNDY